MLNLYWAVYKNLEKELIELSNQIHFDDKQLSVYSVKISDLLIRSSVEIESLAKDLFLANGGVMPTGRDLYFDTDCMEHLENTWSLSKKQVIVSAQNFYFIKTENQILTPLYKANKRGASGSDWKKAYQAVKHNRTLSLSKGNIKHLIRAMAALYMLNIYFKDDEFHLQKDSNAVNFDTGLGSEVFSIKLHVQSNVSTTGGYTKKTDFDECIYFTRATNDTAKIFSDSINDVNKKNQELTTQHMVKVIPEKIKNRTDLTAENTGEIIKEIIEEEKKNLGAKFLIQATRNQKIKFEQLRYESILNKNQV